LHHNTVYGFQYRHKNKTLQCLSERDIMNGDHLEDPGVDGRIILKLTCERLDWGEGGMDWINVAQDRDRWRALVNAVMNLWVP
jgi:hypothetical protein